LADGDGDWIGDACEAYIYGDADGDHAISIADAVYIVNYVFKGGPAPNLRSQAMQPATAPVTSPMPYI